MVAVLVASLRLVAPRATAVAAGRPLRVELVRGLHLGGFTAIPGLVHPALALGSPMVLLLEAGHATGAPAPWAVALPALLQGVQGRARMASLAAAAAGGGIMVAAGGVSLWCPHMRAFQGVGGAPIHCSAHRTSADRLGALKDLTAPTVLSAFSAFRPRLSPCLSLAARRSPFFRANMRHPLGDVLCLRDSPVGVGVAAPALPREALVRRSLHHFFSQMGLHFTYRQLARAGNLLARVLAGGPQRCKSKPVGLPKF